MIKITGLWKEKSKEGKTYYKGNLNKNIKILLFKNEDKTNENSPEFEVYIAKREFEEKKD